MRRERTNTPLQALLLMNDPQYVEAARYLAQKVIDNEDNDKLRLKFLFETALNRHPTSIESNLLIESLRAHRQEFDSHQENAKQLIAIGEQPATGNHDPVELAAWTMMANLVMNMDEFVSKN